MCIELLFSAIFDAIHLCLLVDLTFYAHVHSVYMWSMAPDMHVVSTIQTWDKGRLAAEQ